MTDQEPDQQQLRDIFKKRFIEVVKDMAENVQKDEKQLFVIGAIADMTTAEAKVKGWKAMKQKMDESDFNILLKFFQDLGNEHTKSGDKKRAYAAEILAISLIARNMHDMPAMKQGDEMLDNMIEQTITYYRDNIWRYKPEDKVVN